jgi:hypothetical protein
VVGAVGGRTSTLAVGACDVARSCCSNTSTGRVERNSDRGGDDDDDAAAPPPIIASRPSPSSRRCLSPSCTTPRAATDAASSVLRVCAAARVASWSARIASHCVRAACSSSGTRHSRSQPTKSVPVSVVLLCA